MIKSRHFWIGAALLACIPWLLIDIAEHRLSWQTEVHDQLIYAVQDVYLFSKQNKAAILDKVFARNQTLTLLITGKALLALLILIVGFVQLRAYVKKNKSGFVKPVLYGMGLFVLITTVKLTGLASGNSITGVNFITVKSGRKSFETLISDNFKGKVVYVDFWGTTCGSCLAEFENFTHPLKAKYKTNPNIAYLYISRGSRYLWKQQIEHYKIDGSHLFLADKDYDNLYRNALNNDTAMVFMPHYLIANKAGKVVVADAKNPSDKGQLYQQLDIYLNQQ